MKYKNYQITDVPNEWGYFEAVSLIDCDAQILIDKTLQGLRDQIDDLLEG